MKHTSGLPREEKNRIEARFLRLPYRMRFFVDTETEILLTGSDTAHVSYRETHRIPNNWNDGHYLRTMDYLMNNL